MIVFFMHLCASELFPRRRTTRLEVIGKCTQYDRRIFSNDRKKAAQPCVFFLFASLLGFFSMSSCFLALDKVIRINQSDDVKRRRERSRVRPLLNIRAA